MRATSSVGSRRNYWIWRWCFLLAIWFAVVIFATATAEEQQQQYERKVRSILDNLHLSEFPITEIPFVEKVSNLLKKFPDMESLPLPKTFDIADYENFSFDTFLDLLESTGEPELLKFRELLIRMRKEFSEMPGAENDPDAERSIPEVIIDKGYPAQTHYVTTTDGFHLEIFRIPHGINSTTVGPPVLLSHGLFDSAGTWVVNYPHQSLAYLLADAGFDVWLGNVRGNRYGDTHEEYTERDDEFWDHSFDEHARYDVPNVIDHILNVTGHSKVAAVGHSQGCSQMFGAMELNDHLHEKVSFFAALAPAGYFRHNNNLLVQTLAFLRIADWLHLFGIKKFLPIGPVIEDLFVDYCDLFPASVDLLLGFILGFNLGELNYDRMEVICRHFMGHTTMFNMVHWSQNVRTTDLKWHDYGYFENRDRYGSHDAPFYNITAFPADVPIAFYSGGNDALCTHEDVQIFVDQLTVPPVYTQYVERYAHCDFTWSPNAVNDIYGSIIDLMKQYHKGN